MVRCKTLKVKRRSGFTLVEVVVAASLLIVSIVPILKGLTTAHLNTTLIHRKMLSLTYAESKLDEIIAASIYNYSTPFAADGEVVGGSYLCNVRDGDYGSDLRRITVEVGFDNDRNGSLAAGEVEVTLETLIANRWQ